MKLFQKSFLNITSLVFSLLILRCSEKNPSTHNAGTNDSVQHSDSSNQAAENTTFVHLTYEQRQGRRLYAKYCTVCHGEDGKGDGFNAFNLDPKPRDFTDSTYMSGLSDERMFQTISGGGRSVNKSSLMPSWGGRMEKKEIEFVQSYIRSFASSK